jgi:DnaJ domain
VSKPSDTPPRPRDRFHGRVFDGQHRHCEWPGCAVPGEFRAPRGRANGPDRPDHAWYCLDHIRAFNASWDYFKGMTPAEIEAASRPPWLERPAWPFATNAGTPRMDDPLGLFRKSAAQPRPPLDSATRQALAQLGLDEGATLPDIKQRYKELVRRYHPDANGGDRSAETKLKSVIEAYKRVLRAPGFATSNGATRT